MTSVYLAELIISLSITPLETHSVVHEIPFSVPLAVPVLPVLKLMVLSGVFIAGNPFIKDTKFAEFVNMYLVFTVIFDLVPSGAT